MARRSVWLSVLTLGVLSSSLAAQAAAPTLPNTPAGAVVKAWQDAYGSGDTARVTDFYRKYQPDRVARGSVAYRTQAGGFDIVSIERSEPRRFEFITRERKTPPRKVPA